MANAYVENHHTTREERMRAALVEMGISVVAGAITTFGAGLFLFGATITFFTKVGMACCVALFRC